MILRLVRAHRKGEVTGRRGRASRGVDRRRFLHMSTVAGFGLAAVVLAIPGWAETFGRDDEPPTPNAESTRLRSSIERARSRGVTLLVLRAPEEEPALLRRLGEMWGAYMWLNKPYRGSRARTKRLADLAMCDIVCAVDAEVMRELPDVVAIEGWVDGIALLVEPQDGRVVVVPGPESIVSWDSTDKEREAGKKRLLGELGERMRTALATDVEMIERRAAANYARLDSTQRKSLANLGKTVPSDVWSAEAKHAPACLRLLSETSDVLGEQALASLALSMANRIEESIDGARWQSGSEFPERGGGCATAASPCGTGYGAPSSLWFLRFYTAANPEDKWTRRDRLHH